ncbi:MAG: hypothetical protein Q9162_003358 [Coniocarpon cinnabarinum]
MESSQTSLPFGDTKTLKRSGTKSSTTSGKSTASVHNPRSSDYWNNLICLFTGIGTNPQTRGATSLNNKDNFPSAQGNSARPRSPHSRSPPATAPKRSASFLRNRRSSSTSSSSSATSSLRSSIFSRKRRTTSVESTGSTLHSVPEGAPLPSESQMRAEATQKVLSDVDGERHETLAASCAHGSSGNMIPVMKDGQTLWLPESVISQYLTEAAHQPSGAQFTVPRRSSLRRTRRPGMRIAIPFTASSPRPEDVCNAVRLQHRPSRPVHPLERSSYESSKEGSTTPPGLASDHSDTSSPDAQSPLSCYESGASQSSFSEAQTPADGPSPAGNRYFDIADPAIEGIFDEDRLFFKSQELHLGEIATPGALPFHPGRSAAKPASVEASAPALPARSYKRMPNESGLGPAPRASADACVEAKSINELSLAVSPEASAAFKDTEAPISNDAAEAVILAILSSIDTIEDLFHCALINKGFYGVYKRNEPALIKNVFALAKPAAAEAQEVGLNSYFVDFYSDKTAKSYLKSIKRDAYVLAAVKSLILVRCRSLLRVETIDGLRGRSWKRRLRVDSALWRIWSFCKLFGGHSGWEGNIVDQIDWLTGGHGNANLSFGSGNGQAGLSPEELYDMLELWYCLRSLLIPIFTCPKADRVSQARIFGVFAGHRVKLGDNDSAERCLQEWAAYLLSLGPDVVLDLAIPASNTEPLAFEIARESGWNAWPSAVNPKVRFEFLQRAVVIVYEERAPSFGKLPQHPIERHRNLSKRLSDRLHRAHQSRVLTDCACSEEGSSNRSSPIDASAHTDELRDTGTSPLNCRMFEGIPHHSRQSSTGQRSATGSPGTSEPGSPDRQAQFKQASQAPESFGTLSTEATYQDKFLTPPAQFLRLAQSPISDNGDYATINSLEQLELGECTISSLDDLVRYEGWPEYRNEVMEVNTAVETGHESNGFYQVGNQSTSTVDPETDDEDDVEQDTTNTSGSYESAESWPFAVGGSDIQQLQPEQVGNDQYVSDEEQTRNPSPIQSQQEGASSSSPPVPENWPFLEETQVHHPCNTEIGKSARDQEHPEHEYPGNGRNHSVIRCEDGLSFFDDGSDLSDSEDSEDDVETSAVPTEVQEDKTASEEASTNTTPRAQTPDPEMSSFETPPFVTPFTEAPQSPTSSPNTPISARPRAASEPNVAFNTDDDDDQPVTPDEFSHTHKRAASENTAATVRFESPVSTNIVSDASEQNERPPDLPIFILPKRPGPLPRSMATFHLPRPSFSRRKPVPNPSEPALDRSRSSSKELLQAEARALSKYSSKEVLHASIVNEVINNTPPPSSSAKPRKSILKSSANSLQSAAPQTLSNAQFNRSSQSPHGSPSNSSSGPQSAIHLPSTPGSIPEVSPTPKLARQISMKPLPQLPNPITLGKRPATPNTAPARPQRPISDEDRPPIPPLPNFKATFALPTPPTPAMGAHESPFFLPDTLDASHLAQSAPLPKHESPSETSDKRQTAIYAPLTSAPSSPTSGCSTPAAPELSLSRQGSSSDMHITVRRGTGAELPRLDTAVAKLKAAPPSILSNRSMSEPHVTPFKDLRRADSEKVVVEGPTGASYTSPPLLRSTSEKITTPTARPRSINRTDTGESSASFHSGGRLVGESIAGMGPGYVSVAKTPDPTPPISNWSEIPGSRWSGDSTFSAIPERLPSKRYQSARTPPPPLPTSATALQKIRRSNSSRASPTAMLTGYSRRGSLEHAADHLVPLVEQLEGSSKSPGGNGKSPAKSPAKSLKEHGRHHHFHHHRHSKDNRVKDKDREKEKGTERDKGKKKRGWSLKVPKSAYFVPSIGLE